MAAPSGIVWGSTVNGYGRIGIYKSLSNTNTQSTLNVEVWIWSKYSIHNSSNTLYFDNLASSGSATTSKGSVPVYTNVDTGAGWSTSNQQRLASYSYTYTRGTSAPTRYLYVKLANIWADGETTMTASTTVSIPKLASYTVSYNANGGSGAPASQTKWYGNALTLSSTKPTRTGYSFSKWNTASGGTGTNYNAGASYTANAGATLYAQWTANTYTVTYNANGGTGASSNQTKTYGKTLTLSGTIPKRDGYNFKGWATSKNGSVVHKPSGSYTANAAVTLYAVWELAYKRPTISGFSVTRCDQDANPKDDGTYALVKFNWTTTDSTQSIIIDCFASDNSLVLTRPLSTSDTSGYVSELIGGEPGTNEELTTESAYTVRITIADSGGQWVASKGLPGLIIPLDLLNGGEGVSFGKPAELHGYADFGFKARHRADIEFDNEVTLYGTNPDGSRVDAFNPQNENGNTVIGWGNYERNSGNTNVYGYRVNIGIRETGANTVYVPYICKGVSKDITIRTAGYVTNGGKDVSFCVPFTRPILGSPTVSVTSKNGFTLRQGDKYTHGSSASEYTHPASYAVASTTDFGVMITASFTNTTNVTNNDAIGIFWNGTITFE